MNAAGVVFVIYVFGVLNARWFGGALRSHRQPQQRRTCLPLLVMPITLVLAFVSWVVSAVFLLIGGGLPIHIGGRLLLIFVSVVIQWIFFRINAISRNKQRRPFKKTRRRNRRR